MAEAVGWGGRDIAVIRGQGEGFEFGAGFRNGENQLDRGRRSSGMRSRRSIPTVSVPPANNDITIRINDIRHIDIGVLISNVISIDHIINVFCGRVLIIMSVVVNAIRDISCMHI
ncbi:hypothetical protein [uncultured Pseudoramibacter sp.]|uniref:hypothetical protein n=1 Tax=uncultured Pseudoramibacter sp. TaxID=1623493 RepID=UPI0025D5523E|nr:hypothetical protein [uncultured Pseudoramibacter sp.]